MQEILTSGSKGSMAEQHYNQLYPSKSDGAERGFFQNQLFPCSGNDNQSQAEFAISWRQLKEVGLFNESLDAEKHRNALLDRESKLQKELLNYQHNMGLLLIEKDEWAQRLKQLSEDVEEVRAILRREKQKNLMEFSESQIREENLNNSLTTTKQSIINYRKIHRDLQEDYNRVRNGLDTITENHGLKPEHNSNSDMQEDELHATSSQLEKKRRELDSRERVVNNEQVGFRSMREEHEMNLKRRREELKEMEKRQRNRMEEMGKMLRD